MMDPRGMPPLQPAPLLPGQNPLDPATGLPLPGGVGLPQWALKGLLDSPYAIFAGRKELPVATPPQPPMAQDPAMMMPGADPSMAAPPWAMGGR